MTLAAKFGIVALIALALSLLPGGGSVLEVALRLLTVVFLVAIALLGAHLYREHRSELDALGQRERLVLYGSIGVALLVFAATTRLFDQGGPGAVAWLGLLALCSSGIFWVWVSYRSYE